MSLQARQELVSRLVFQRDSQKSDLLDESVTQTDLIAMLLYITGKYDLEITAVKSDHSNDSYLGVHCHWNGWCVDCWPIYNRKPGAYYDAGSQDFRDFLHYCAEAPDEHQVGEAGSAYTPANLLAAGSTAFQDDGFDHVHLGSS